MTTARSRRRGTDAAAWRRRDAGGGSRCTRRFSTRRPRFATCGRSRAARSQWRRLSTVNVGPIDVDRPFEQHSVPGYREIIDLSPANDSRFLTDASVVICPDTTTIPDWRAVKHRKMRMERPTLTAARLERSGSRRGTDKFQVRPTQPQGSTQLSRVVQLSRAQLSRAQLPRAQTQEPTHGAHSQCQLKASTLRVNPRDSGARRKVHLTLRLEP